MVAHIPAHQRKNKVQDHPHIDNKFKASLDSIRAHGRVEGGRNVGRERGVGREREREREFGNSGFIKGLTKGHSAGKRGR